jgi:hypothetical protein
MGVDDKGKALPIYVNCSFCLLDLLLYMDDDSRYRFKDVKWKGNFVHGLDVVLLWEGEIKQKERFSDVTCHQIGNDALYSI